MLTRMTSQREASSLPLECCCLSSLVMLEAKCSLNFLERALPARLRFQ